MKAWNIDANNINIDELNTVQLNNYMVRTREIDDFLNSDTKKMFIVAPKGLGKTYLLKVKSQLFRETKSGYKFIPNSSLCERFTSNDFSFSKNDLEKFNNFQIWKKTWEIALCTLILKSFNESLIPKEITTIIGNAGSLAEILGTLIQHRGQIVNLNNYVSSHLKPAVRKLSDESSVNQVAIFIDNIDEAFDNYVGYAAKSNYSLTANIWIYAQLSILIVAKEICAVNNHVKIFLTIRSEAYNNNQDPQRLQLDDVSVILKYTKSEIKNIFNKNISLTPGEDLCFPYSKNPIVSLLGYDKVQHKFVEDELGNKLEESFFDFMYRHTYGRPREIVLMGKRIIEKLKPSERTNTNLVGSIVNEVSYDLFEQLKREIIPIFEDDIFEEFCEKVERNIIKYSEAETIELEIGEKMGFPSVFSYLHRLGIVGVIQTFQDYHGGVQRQTFLSVGEYTLLDNKAPMTDFYILHPSVNKKMKQIHDVGYYNKLNIIGYDNEFFQRNNHVHEHHMHFGLDRDSLTIILPEFYNFYCLVVVVTPSPQWSHLEDVNTLILDLNGTEYSFKIFKDTLSSSEKNQILDEWRNKVYNVIIYSCQVDEIRKFYKNVTALSVCLYTPYTDLILKLASNYPSKTKILNYCLREFVELGYQEFKDCIESKVTNILVEPIIIDRYQYSQSILFNGEEKILRVVIASENYCRIICMNKSGGKFRNNSVVQNYSDNISFYYNIFCKNYIVEGLYQFYKVFKQNTTSDEDFSPLVNTFTDIQISRLFAYTDKWSEDTLFTVFLGKTKNQIHEDLKVYSEHTLNRVTQLFNKYNVTNNSLHSSTNKLKKIFPSDLDFFQFVSNIKYLEEKNLSILFLLHNILAIKSSDKYYSVFISYSNKDSHIANFIFRKLTINGINVNLFEEDNPHKSLNKYMVESVNKADKLLFISSKNSLTSDGCHVELSACRELIRMENNKSRLIAIRLDNYIFETPEFEISDVNRKQNFSMLKEYFLAKIAPIPSDMNYLTNLKSINDNIRELINFALFKD